VSVEVAFRAKREDDVVVWGADGVVGSASGYRIPLLTMAHVVTPRAGWGSWVQLWVGCGGRKTRDFQDGLLRANGFRQTDYVFGGEVEVFERLRVEPLGRGFMARVTLRLDRLG